MRNKAIFLFYLKYTTAMGNKILRPSDLEPLSGFNDDQIGYLKDKFQILCDESKLLSVTKIAQAFKCSRDEASKILNYIDFQNQGEVDFYQFTCAAATLHQNDDDALEFLYDLFGNGQQLDESSFEMLFGTVFRYLKFLDRIKQDYEPEIATKKFAQYDFNANKRIGFDQFKSMLKNDFHCRQWMEILGFAEQSQVEALQKPINQQNVDEFAVEEAAGQQAGSTPSWIKTINYMAPDNKDPPPGIQNPPTANLQIQYVYGYRCYDTRDNLRYNVNGDPVYHTGGCGIILNKIKNTMKISTEHNDDVTCLDLNLGKNLVVTGQMGRRPSLVIWDSNTAETKFVFKSKLQKSIGSVAISKSGRYVAASSMSDNHQIAVYDLTKNALIAFGQGPRSVIYGIKFTANEEEIVCACQKQVVFAKFSNGRIETKKGIFGKAPLVANFCISLVGDAIVTGMANGALGYWKGNVCSRVYKEHVKPVTALCERKDGGLISGDSSGSIVIWTPNLSKQRQIQLTKLTPNSNNPRIISLCQGFGNILIGTRGGQIIQLQQKSSSATVLMQGHFDEELWGLAVGNNRHQFFTGGQDKLLIKWDGDKRKIVMKKKLDYSIMSIDISRNNQLAVGHTNGVVNIYESDKLKYLRRIQTFKNPDKQVISVVKYSPNGKVLAVGYCPPVSQVYLYNAQNGNKIGICKGSPSRITSIDFTRDASAIMVNNTSYEILFYNANNASQITTATSFRNQEFATMTCRFSWHTQGIWPPCSDGTDINSLDRSNSKKYLVTADDFSKVKLFKYPVCKSRQIYNAYKGHSSHVTGVKWTYDDRFVISTGGLEKSIIQWSFEDAQQLNYQYEEKPEKQQEQQKADNEQYEEQLEEEEKPEKGEEGQFQMDVDQGDQALAVKPFLGQVKASTPSSLKSLNVKNIQPEQDLSIKHVWGIRNQYINDRVRNQLKYSSDYKSCFFITAALGVQMDLKTKAQKFYQGQSQDLISFSITNDRKFCATGQMAQLNTKQPKSKIVDVHIWSTDTKQRKVKLSGFHQRAVVVVEFSPSGKKILTVGQDDKNSLAVYDWEINRIAWSSPVCGAKVTGGAWRNENEFMTVGLKHVKLWTNKKGVMCKIPGKWDPMVSVVSWNDKYVSGGSEGTLYLWSGTSAVASKGHESRVDCLQVDQSGALFSGCSSGVINKWKYSGGKLVLDKKIVNMAEFDKFSPGVLSLDFSPDNYLICTNSSSIYQIPKNGKESPNIVMQSHYQVQLWGEAWSPDSKKFVTGGDDKTIRIYDASTFEMLHSYKMDQRVRGLDWQKTKGELIVVGDNRGRIFLFDSELKLLSQAKTRFSKTKPRKQPFWIEDIKFSPNGEHVAFGAHGGATYIDIFEIKDKQFGAETTIPSLISSAMLSVDWSQDSSNLAVVSQAYELQFTNLTSKVSASSVREVKWATWTGKFGAYVQQIHQDVDYSNINAVDMSPTGTLIATGGDDQKIRLFKSPVIIPKQKNKQFVGHSSHVTKVRFSRNQQYLLSVGGNDRTIILWKVIDNKQDEEQEDAQNQAEENEEQAENQQGDNDDAEEITIPKSKQELEKKEAVKKDVDQGEFNLEEDQGDQFMAVKPWLGAIKEPTKQYYKSSGKAPNCELDLQYAHGYRTKDCRNNLIYLSQNEIAYHTAGLGVIMNIETTPRSQKFFNLHNDDIISMCWNEDKSSVFTGQMGAKPTIYQWNKNGEMVQKYKGAKKSVSAIGVNEKYLAAAAMDDDHYITLFDLASGKQVCTEKGGRQFITAIRWVDGETFVTAGIKHYKVWSVADKKIKGKTGVFGKNCNILCCLAVKDSNIYAGASDGSLQVWSGNSCSKSLKIHEKSLNVIKVMKNVILTGSKDGTIGILDHSLKIICKIDCKSILESSVCPEIEALDVFENKIIVGTKGSEIYELRSKEAIEEAHQNSQIKLSGQHMSGHFAPNHVTNEVWGLAVYDSNSYLTCSDDGTLRAWDIDKKEQITCCNLDITEKLQPRKPKPGEKFLPKSCKGNSITVSKNGYIVVGCKDGRIIVLDNKFRARLVQTVSKKQISVVKLSPDQSVLAVGDHQGRIYILNWNQGTGKLKVKHNKIKHHSTIKNLDFSRDSNIIHSTCTSYELLFWDVNTGQQITSGATSTRDEQWATWTLTLGWPVQGVFEQFMDGTDVNAVDRSKRTYGEKGMRLLASSDDRGQVRLLQYPCIVKNSQSVVGRGHSSHVTNISFSNNDEYIFSTGGEDQTVLQWKVNA